MKISYSHGDPDLVEDNTYIFPAKASIHVTDFSEPYCFIDFQIFYSVFIRFLFSFLEFMNIRIYQVCIK